MGRFFESALWNSRYIVVLAVIASLIASITLFFVAGLDVWRLIGEVVHYADPALHGAERAAVRRATIVDVAEIIDNFLFASILLIFALGLYELFISKIDVAETSEVAEHVLLIRSIDDLKERLTKVVFLILIIRYFEFALQAPLENQTELLYLAAGIALIAVGLWLTRTKH